MQKTVETSVAGALAALLLSAAACQSTNPGSGSAAPELTEAQQQVLLVADPAAPADLRRGAIDAIAESTAGGEAVYLKLYRAVLSDPATDATVAATCAFALARHGDAADAETLARLLTRETAYARWVGAIGLQRLHNPAVADELARALGDEDADVRTAAAVALGQYPRRDVYDALVRALEDPDYGVARAAQESLTVMTGHPGDDDPGAWLDHARSRGGRLFSESQAYRYERYDGAGGWTGTLRRLTGRRDTLVSGTPAGLERPETAEP